MSKDLSTSTPSLSLAQLLAGKDYGERVYLLLRAMGVNKKQSLGVVDQWGMVLPDEQLEALLSDGNWRQQAKDEFMMTLRPQALIALSQIVALSNNWAGLDRTDKGCVMKAIQMVLVMTEPAEKVQPMGYEELVFSLRRKLVPETGGVTVDKKPLSLVKDYDPRDPHRMPTYLEYKAKGEGNAIEGHENKIPCEEDE